MSIKTFVSAVFATFVGFLPAVSMAGVVYDAELVNPWFATGVTNLSNAGGAAVTITEPPTENWTLPLEGEVVATNQLLKFEADALAPLVYTPGGEGSVVSVVNVHLFVEPNVMMPDTNGMDLAQAALTVVTNAANENLDWVGLVRCDATNAWVRLSGDTPVAGAEYDVQIVIDNGDSKRICYLVKGPEADEFTPLTLDEAVWLDNPKQTESSVSAVAFAGVGTIGEFSGTQIFDDGAGIGELVNGAVGGQKLIQSLYTTIINDYAVMRLFLSLNLFHAVTL